MQPFQCDSQHQLANPHLSTHRTTPDDNSHAAIPMRSATRDSTTPYNYAHTTTPKAASSHHYTAVKKKTTNRPQPQPSHTRGTFHRRLQPLYTEKHKVSCSGFLPQTKPMQHSCSHSNAVRSINSQTCTYLRTEQHQMTTVMQPFQCDLQPEIPKHPVTTHTQPHPKQLQTTVTLRQKKNDKPTAAATVAHTRYLSSPAAATLHGKTQGFVLRLPPENIAHATSCSHSNAICNHSVKNMHRTTHTDTTTHCRTQRRNQSRPERPQPQPSHTRGTFHRRLQPLYTEKHKVSCSCIVMYSFLLY